MKNSISIKDVVWRRAEQLPRRALRQGGPLQRIIRNWASVMHSPQNELRISSHGSSRWATSLGLVQDLKNNTQDSWGRFVHLYTPLIYFWSRRAGLQEADAADICQTVFRAVSSGIGRFRYDRPDSSFRGWLWTITRHELSHFYGRQYRTQQAAGGTDAMKLLSETPDWIDNEEIPDAPAAEAEVIRRAAEGVRHDFEEHTWQAFWMSVVEEIPTSEIADRLNMSANGVRQAKFRVLKRLREFVDFL